DLRELFFTRAVLVKVARCRKRERSGRGIAGADDTRGSSGQARIARVLQLLESNDQRDIISAGGYGKRGIAQRVLAGRAHVFDTSDRYVLELERPRERLSGDA